MRPGENPGTATRPGIPAEFAAEFEASPFLSSLAEAVGAAKESKLKERAPGKFYAANQANFQGDPNLRISHEAAQPGGEVEISPADYLSTEHERQTVSLPDVIDPFIDLSARELRDGRVELQQWQADGGLEKLQTALAQNDPEHERVKRAPMTLTNVCLILFQRIGYERV